MSIQVIWRGFVFGASGYARASREYILALDRAGIDVKVEALIQQGQSIEDISDEEQKKRIIELANKPYAEGKKKAIICHIQPDAIDVTELKAFYDYVIINTVWETTHLPASWDRGLKQADAIFVPSIYNVNIFKQAGYANVYHVPHGADTERFRPDIRPLPVQDIQGKFTFLSVSTWQHRKAPELLLRAYWEEFTGSEPVALIYKIDISGNKRNEPIVLENIVKFKESLKLSNPPLTLVSLSSYTDEQLSRLYTAAHTFVMPSRGEGVGLPYIEALSSGLPVISTGWGGQTDFVHSGNAFLIDAKLQDIQFNQPISPTFDHLFVPPMQWAEPDIASLRKQMRYAFSHFDDCRKKGQQGRADMEKMTWDIAAANIKAALDEISTKSKEGE